MTDNLKQAQEKIKDSYEDLTLRLPSVTAWLGKIIMTIAVIALALGVLVFLGFFIILIPGAGLGLWLWLRGTNQTGD